MAQKFITKRNKHLFRKPVKVTPIEKMVVEFPPIEASKNEELLQMIIEPEIIKQEIIKQENLIEDEPKKEKVKKDKIKKTKDAVDNTNKTEEQE